jgi:NitT/TauT family transport system ATP-binding protein
MGDTKPAVEVMNLRKEFHTDSGTLTAVENVSFRAMPGEFWAIVGPSGCGKTTLLKLIGDLMSPTSGEIRVQGMSANEARVDGSFSYVFQNPVLLPWRRVRQNVHLPLEILKRKNGRDPDELLHLVGLADFGDRFPNELSGGMQQRVAIARALTYEPQFLLMDEPFGALDELTRDAMNVELLRIWEKVRINVFLVTHSLTEAAFLADKVLVLSTRPAQVSALVEIPFLRPRSKTLRDTAEFQEVVRCLRGSLN